MGNNDSGKGLSGLLGEIGGVLGSLIGGGKLDDDERLRIEVFFGLFGYLAKSDGIVTSHEVEFVNSLMEEYKLNTKGKEAAHYAFERGRHGLLDANVEMNRYLERYPTGSEQVEQLYTVLLHLAAADGRFYARERAALNVLSIGLGYTTEEMDSRMNGMLGR